MRTKANIFTRLSILFRPRQKRQSQSLPAKPAYLPFVVEPPGTAPGSSPLITCAFIVIAVASLNIIRQNILQDYKKP